MIALVGVELVFEGFVGLTLFEFADLDVLEVEPVEGDGFARAEIPEQLLVGGFEVAFVDGPLDGLQSGAVEIEQVVERFFVAEGRDLTGQRRVAD